MAYVVICDYPLCRGRRLDDPLTCERHDMNLWDLHPTFATYNNQIFYIFRVSAFSFYLKKKTPAKEKQTQGCAPRPRERRAAVLSSRLSISCSAHSRANAPELERVRARASCCASRSALSKHSRLSPLERALCSLFFANIASLHPPPAALR